MTLDDFRQSLTATEPPAGLTLALAIRRDVITRRGLPRTTGLSASLWRFVSATVFNPR